MRERARAREDSELDKNHTRQENTDSSNFSTPKKSVKLEPKSSDTELYRKLKDTLNRTSSSDADASTEAEKTESNGLDAVLDKFEDFCYACI